MRCSADSFYERNSPKTFTFQNFIQFLNLSLEIIDNDIKVLFFYLSYKLTFIYKVFLATIF